MHRISRRYVKMPLAIAAMLGLTIVATWFVTGLGQQTDFVVIRSAPLR